MSVRSLRKQMLAATAMVLVALIAVSASTYAWFAANGSVRAQNMSVTVKADSAYLQIKGTGGTVSDGSIAGDGNDFDITGAVVMTGVKLYPAAHNALANNAAITAAKADPATDTANWYYRYSSAPDDRLGDHPTDAASVSVAAFHQYVAEVTYQVCIIDDPSTPEVYDLYVNRLMLPNKTGITALVAGSDRYQEFSAVNDNAYARSAAVQLTNASPVSLSDTVTSTPQTVTVYLYIDGNDVNVTSENLQELLGDVELKFACYEVDTL